MHYEHSDNRASAGDLVKRAEQFAIKAHARINQRRKYSLDPYEVHLRDVAGIVAEVSDDAEMIASAWLHDTIEDTAMTHDDIEREFGAGVARLVLELTDVSKPSDGNRRTRKAMTCVTPQHFGPCENHQIG
jgi:(p)ppGpp synthase/HD superfamily hydrolase